MLGPQIGFFLALGLMLVVGAAVWKRCGLIPALGIFVVTSFAMPVWVEFPIAGIPFSLQTTAAAVGLLVFAVTNPRKLLSPLVFLDVVVVGFVVLQAASDTYHGWPVTQSGLLAYGEWAIPYFAGRYALRDLSHLEELAMAISVVVVILGVGGLIEMVTDVNLWEVLFGNRPVDGTNRNAARFGFQRAYGPTLHPIFFGLLILTLTPWPLTLIRWAKNAPQRSLAGIALASSIGIIAPVSRSPVLGMGMFLALTSAVWYRTCRWILGIVTILLVIWMVVDFDGMLTLMETMGGEKRRETKMRLDGEELEVSSAKLRLIQVQVLWPAYAEAGWLGYGSEATSELPPHVPHLPADEKTRQRLKFMDNAFLLFGLRMGWLGTALFALLFGGAIWTGIRLSWDRSVGLLAGSLAGMVTTMFFMMLTTWFSYDMGFEILWTIGVLSGLASSRK